MSTSRIGAETFKTSPRYFGTRNVAARQIIRDMVPAEGQIPVLPDCEWREGAVQKRRGRE